MLLIIDRPVEVPLRRSASAGRALKKRPGAKAWVEHNAATKERTAAFCIFWSCQEGGKRQMFFRLRIRFLASYM
jgi:hypothetical protein